MKKSTVTLQVKTNSEKFSQYRTEHDFIGNNIKSAETLAMLSASSLVNNDLHALIANAEKGDTLTVAVGDTFLAVFSSKDGNFKFHKNATFEQFEKNFHLGINSQYEPNTQNIEKLLKIYEPETAIKIDQCSLVEDDDIKNFIHHTHDYRIENFALKKECIELRARLEAAKKLLENPNS